MSIDSDLEEDAWASNGLFQRRTSLTFPKPLGTKDNFHNRSLQDFSERIKVNVVDEVDTRKRKQSIFNCGISKSDELETRAMSCDSISSDSANDEWKQVSSLQLFQLLYDK